jgi:hypothetical protein
MPGARCARCSDQTKDVFGEEKDANDSEPGIKPDCPILPPGRFRIGKHYADTCDEHRMMSPRNTRALTPGGSGSRSR